MAGACGAFTGGAAGAVGAGPAGAGGRGCTGSTSIEVDAAEGGGADFFIFCFCVVGYKGLATTGWRPERLVFVFLEGGLAGFTAILVGATGGAGGAATVGATEAAATVGGGTTAGAWAAGAGATEAWATGAVVEVATGGGMFSRRRGREAEREGGATGWSLKLCFALACRKAIQPR